MNNSIQSDCVVFEKLLHAEIQCHAPCVTLQQEISATYPIMRSSIYLLTASVLIAMVPTAHA